MVYRARQSDLDRSVVVKVLTNLDAETTRRRFDRERKAMGRLSQATGIAPLYGSGFTPAGQPYLLMPFYERGSLQERIAGGAPLPAAEVRKIGVSIANAVQTAHENGVLHRDLKPANILMTRTGKADVADFGIAHLVDDALGTSQALTMTPLYTAPEVFDGAASGVLGDVYSLGATLFALLRGYPAYGDPEGSTPVLSLMRRMNEEPLPALPASVPTELAAVVIQAMSKNPADRPASAGELAAQLTAVDVSPPKTTQKRMTRSPVLMAALAALVIAAIGGAVLAALMLDNDEDETDGSEGVVATAAPVTTPTALPVATSTPSPTEFDAVAATAAARQALVRIEVYGCAGVDVATGVVLPGGSVVTTSGVMDSPWYVEVSAPGGRLGHATVTANQAREGLALITIDDTAGFDPLSLVTVADGEQVAIVGIDGRPAIATIVAPEDPRVPLQATLIDSGSGNAIERVDAVVSESGSLVGIASPANGIIEVLTPQEAAEGPGVAPDYDCPTVFDRDLGPADAEAVVSPAIGELLAMQQLNNAYAAEQWAQVRRIEPAKRSFTDQQFVNGWRPLRQGFVFPVDRQVEDDGTARWRIGLIGYETWNGTDLTTLYCLTWTVDPVSGAVVQTNEDNVLVYGSQPGEDQRNGFIRPASLRSLITTNCPLDPS